MGAMCITVAGPITTGSPMPDLFRRRAAERAPLTRRTAALGRGKCVSRCVILRSSVWLRLELGSLMASAVHNIVFDSTDPYALAQFWSEVTGQPLAADDFPGDPEASIAQPGGATLFFCAVPEPKVVKNRVHVCLRPEGSPDAEAERLLGLGATLVDDRRTPEGGWVVLADPEANEFCVLRRKSSD